MLDIAAPLPARTGWVSALRSDATDKTVMGASWRHRRGRLSGNRLCHPLEPVWHLLRARELAQTTATQVHLAGLVNRVVARPSQITELLERFDTYPTLTDALAAVAD